MDYHALMRIHFLLLALAITLLSGCATDVQQGAPIDPHTAAQLPSLEQSPLETFDWLILWFIRGDGTKRHYLLDTSNCILYLELADYPPFSNRRYFMLTLSPQAAATFAAHALEDGDMNERPFGATLPDMGSSRFRKGGSSVMMDYYSRGRSIRAYFTELREIFDREGTALEARPAVIAKDKRMRKVLTFAADE